MNEQQKAEQRLRDAAEKYREATEAEQKAFREWLKAGRALDEIEAGDAVSTSGEPL